MNHLLPEQFKTIAENFYGVTYRLEEICANIGITRKEFPHMCNLLSDVMMLESATTELAIMHKRGDDVEVELQHIEDRFDCIARRFENACELMGTTSAHFAACCNAYADLMQLQTDISEAAKSKARIIKIVQALRQRATKGSFLAAAS